MTHQVFDTPRGTVPDEDLFNPEPKPPVKSKKYLDLTDFGGYAIEIEGDEITVYGCDCLETMSVDVARKVHEALGRFLDDH